MRPSVFVTRADYPRVAVDILRDQCDVEVFAQKRAITKDELIAAVRGKDGILALVTDKIDREVIEAADKLKIIASWGEGYDHIDVAAATEKEILVTNTPSEDIADAVAVATVGLFVALTRRVVEGDKAVRAGKFKGWGPFDWLGPDLKGKTFGIIGLGRIGKKVARMLQGWDMNIVYTDEARSQEFEERFWLQYVDLETLLRESDFISLHVPRMEATYHLIGKRELALMKRDAYIINTSRGAVIDEKALVAALTKRQIAGAALDVFENEPGLSPGLRRLPNVVLTPHCAGATPMARVNPAILASKNLLAGLRGEIPPNLVNPVRDRKRSV